MRGVMDSLVKHLGSLVALFVPLAILGLQWGMISAKIDALDDRLTSVESSKVAEIKMQGEFNAKRIDKLEADKEKMLEAIQQMDKKLSLIADWVQEQKQKNP